MRLGERLGAKCARLSDTWAGIGLLSCPAVSAGSQVVAVPAVSSARLPAPSAVRIPWPILRAQNEQQFRKFNSRAMLRLAARSAQAGSGAKSFLRVSRPAGLRNLATFGGHSSSLPAQVFIDLNWIDRQLVQIATRVRSSAGARGSASRLFKFPSTLCSASETTFFQPARSMPPP